MVYSLTGVTSLGTIQNITSTKDSNLFKQAMPGNDSSQSIVLDLFGAERTITVKGVFTASTIAALTTFVLQLDALIAGTQSGITFNASDISQSYTVRILNVEWVYDSDEGPMKIAYTIQMQEGAA